jgi:hypothetical protein
MGLVPDSQTRIGFVHFSGRVSIFLSGMDSAETGEADFFLRGVS